MAGEGEVANMRHTQTQTQHAATGKVQFLTGRGATGAEGEIDVTLSNGTVHVWNSNNSKT